MLADGIGVLLVFGHQGVGVAGDPQVPDGDVTFVGGVQLDGGFVQVRHDWSFRRKLRTIELDNLILSEFSKQADRSIALDVIYLKSFECNSIRRRVGLANCKNELSDWSDQQMACGASSNSATRARFYTKLDEIK